MAVNALQAAGAQIDTMWIDVETESDVNHPWWPTNQVTVAKGHICA